MNPKYIFSLLALITYSNVQAQDFSHQYWQMRQRLLDKFIRVGDCRGCSLPATLYDYIPGDNGHRYLSWHDKTPGQLGWYNAMLANENYLLRLNNASEAKMQQNCEELFFALKAIDRLDKYGEFLYCADSEDQYLLLSLN